MQAAVLRRYRPGIGIAVGVDYKRRKTRCQSRLGKHARRTRDNQDIGAPVWIMLRA